MDGYAVRAVDTAGAAPSAPARLRVLERIYTGAPPTQQLTSGACSEIATGAPIPPGSDAVVMVEDTVPVDTDHVDITKAATVGQHIGRQGADMRAGSLVIRAGDLLHTSRLGALAAIGATTVAVYARPRVAIISNGNEVVPPGAVLAPGQVYDINRVTLSAIVEANGGLADARPHVDDRLDALIDALDACTDADLIVCSGGSSVGERDLVLDAVRARGEVLFHGIAVRPGKPTGFARLGTTPLFAMPGNPSSCLSNAFILLVPYLRALARLPVYDPRTVTVPLGRAIVSPAGRHQFYTVRLADGCAWPAFKGSGEITSLSQADGYIEIPADQDGVAEGAMVRVTLF